MVIIQMMGGLGNQLFQYALYRQFLFMGKEVAIDDVSGFLEDERREPLLEMLGLSYERASKRDIERITDSAPDIVHKVRRKLLGRKKRSYFEEDKLFHPEIFSWDEIYLEGYWQSERYFADAADKLRAECAPDKLLETLRSKNRLSGQAERCLEQIKRTESVGIHIRRGDYLLPENQKLFGGICTEAYYERAIGHMCRELENPVFYLFTNDVPWADAYRRKLERIVEDAEAKRQDKERVVVIDLQDSEDCVDMCLMAECRHNILANSSFSWWASYLNPNPQRKVIAPDKWLNGWDCRDIYRADMQMMSGDR